VRTAAFAFGLLFLLIGVLGFVRGVTTSYRSLALASLSVGGACYLVLFLYGLIASQDPGTNFVRVNPADDILDLMLGISWCCPG
jgi:hypothetical protein